jgi:hypothetical protein
VTSNGTTSDQARIGVSAGGFKYCGDQALMESQTVQGSVRFDVRIDERGDTTSITPSERSGLTDAEVQCVQMKLDGMSFDKGPRVMTVRFTQKIAPATP